MDYAARCLEALGVRSRVTHTELKLSPAGIELIEVNGRTAGYLAKLLQAAGGEDLIRCALMLAAGQAPRPTGRHPLDHTLLLLPPFPVRGGAVRSAVTMPQLRDLPGVIGVDEVAEQGQQRSATGHRMVAMTVRAPGAAELDSLRAAVMFDITRLFADDLTDPVPADDTVSP